MNSRIPGFYAWSLDARRERLAVSTGWDGDAFAALDPGSLTLAHADKMIENVVGVLGLPIGLGLNLQVNGEDILVPMVVEEPSVVAAFSHAAKMARRSGGVTAEADPSHMIAQVQTSAPDLEAASRMASRIEDARARISKAASDASSRMAERGGGFREMQVRILDEREEGGESTQAESQPRTTTNKVRQRSSSVLVVVHLIVDVLDAMGANAVNRVAEATAPVIEGAAQAPVNLRILTNLATSRLARARVALEIDDIGGASVATRIEEADRFARLDPYRAATHNKGIFNGIDAVALATGNDWRSIEAGGHAYAARSGRYRGLTRWEIEDSHLVGEIELPMAVGIVGGSTRTHPTVARLRSLMGVQSARHLACILAAVGLIQNLGALRALADEGIQRGHMELHTRQIALSLGAEPEEVSEIVGLALASGDGPTEETVRRALIAHRAAKGPK